MSASAYSLQEIVCSNSGEIMVWFFFFSDLCSLWHVIGRSNKFSLIYTVCQFFMVEKMYFMRIASAAFYNCVFTELWLIKMVQSYLLSIWNAFVRFPPPAYSIYSYLCNVRLYNCGVILINITKTLVCIILCWRLRLHSIIAITHAFQYISL